MVLSNSERQARYQQRLRQTAYENTLLHQQIRELEVHLNETRRAVRLPEVQLSKSAYDSREVNVSSKLEGDAKAVLDKVQAIFSGLVPGSSCELQDYEHRIGCGALDSWDQIQDVVFLRRDITVADVKHYATVLATKVQTGGSTAGSISPPMDEDDLRDLKEAEDRQDRSRNRVTGY